jgi:hypothetical protein
MVPPKQVSSKSTTRQGQCSTYTTTKPDQHDYSLARPGKRKRPLPTGHMANRPAQPGQRPRRSATTANTQTATPASSTYERASTPPTTAQFLSVDPQLDRRGWYDTQRPMTDLQHSQISDNCLNGASRARTDDLLAASQTLFQLSYSPESAINRITLGPPGRVSPPRHELRHVQIAVRIVVGGTAGAGEGAVAVRPA